MNRLFLIYALCLLFAFFLLIWVPSLSPNTVSWWRCPCSNDELFTDIKTDPPQASAVILKEQPKPPLNPCFKKDMQGCKPQFIIIGAQKGGTTGLYNWVCLHPQVRQAKDKEICTLQTQDYYKGEDFYYAKYPNLSHAESVITGEACPGYMIYPWTASRVKQILPDVKIIAILRNPVERAFSQYQMYRKLKFVDKWPTFEIQMNYSLPHVNDIINGLEDCREKNLENINCNIFTDNWYWSDIFLTSIYAYQLRHWFSEFPRDQFLILQSEQIWSHPQESMARVFKFLGLPEYGLSDLKPVFEGIYESKLNNASRLALQNYYREFNEDLYKLVGWGPEMRWY